jgi:hypothetical protein
MISEALQTKIVDGLFNPAFYAALFAFLMAVVNRYKSSAQHDEQAQHLSKQDEKLEVIRADVNSNLETVTTNLDATHATVLSLTADAAHSAGVIEGRDDAGKK